jgi:hypothetical protein
MYVHVLPDVHVLYISRVTCVHWCLFVVRRRNTVQRLERAASSLWSADFYTIIYFFSVVFFFFFSFLSLIFTNLVVIA